MVDVQAPETLPVNGGPGHYIAYVIRLLNYLSVTVVMIYTGNLTERELPRLKLIRWLGWVFVVTVVGGLLGTAFPHFGYDSPLKSLLPGSLQSIDFVQQFTHIETAQVQYRARVPAAERAVRVRERVGQQLLDAARLVRHRLAARTRRRGGGWWQWRSWRCRSSRSCTRRTVACGSAWSSAWRTSRCGWPCSAATASSSRWRSPPGSSVRWSW